MFERHIEPTSVRDIYRQLIYASSDTFGIIALLNTYESLFPQNIDLGVFSLEVMDVIKAKDIRDQLFTEDELYRLAVILFELIRDGNPTDDL